MNTNNILIPFIFLIFSTFYDNTGLYATNLPQESHFVTIDSLTDEISIAKYSYYYTDTANITADNLQTVQWREFSGIPTFQPSKNSHWFKTIIKNRYNSDIDKVLYIPYTSIHSIDVYFETADTIVRVMKTGTERDVRNKMVRMSGYPVLLHFKANTTSTVYVRFKHIYRPLRATMYLMSREHFLQIRYKSQVLLWLWRGIYLFAIVVSVIAFIFLKQKSFLYYSIINTGVTLYVFSHIGEVSMILGADPTNLSSAIDYVGAFLINISLPLFINTLTPIKENNKTLWRIMSYFVMGMIPFIVLSFIPAIRLNFVTGFIHMYIMFVSSIVFLSLVYAMIKNALKKDSNALIMLFIYFIYISVTFVDIILPNMGFLEDNNFICKHFFAGSFIEVFSFMFLMSKQTLNVYKERARLSDEHKNYRKELLYSIVKSQETERIRTGRELHDLVGANLAIIKQKTDSSDTELLNLISSTIDSIRRLSHGLVVSDIKGSEFKDEIKDLCYSANTGDMKFYVYFHSWPDIKDSIITTHLFRIAQELVQNAIKHSKAKSVYLQFIGEENNKILFMYEDDGIGFDVEKASKGKGMGIENIKKRVNLLNASFTLESKLNGMGTSVIIEISYDT